MKKVIILLFIISSLYLVNKKNDIIIPSDAIRFRIIANSNSFEDQKVKKSIKDELVNEVFINIKDKESIENNIPNIKSVIDKYNVDYDINYGINYFPEKKYKGVTYPSGNYDSLVITLEDGLGDNYWCVMYPPLCLIDSNESNEVEYKIFVSEIINNYKNNVN